LGKVVMLDGMTGSGWLLPLGLRQSCGSNVPKAEDRDRRRSAAEQRLRPVAAISRTLADSHQAGIRHDDHRMPEGQQCKVQPPLSKLAAH